MAEGVIDKDYVLQLEKEYKDKLEENLRRFAKNQEKTVITPFMQDEPGWISILLKKIEMIQPVDTTYPKDKLAKITKVISNLPEVTRNLSVKSNVWFSRDKKCLMRINWIGQWPSTWLMEPCWKKDMMLEFLGQDVERGTFSHRHAVVKVEDSEEEILLLNQINDEQQGNFYIYNSLLSEYGVVGFDYGYAMASPKTLNNLGSTIW